jgi:hypothetical protein
MTKTLIILAVALLVGCGKPAETSTSVGREFVVDKLFTHEGCTVYRFTDHGKARYFTNCQGSTNWTEGCGKGCTRQMDID